MVPNAKIDVHYGALSLCPAKKKRNIFKRGRAGQGHADDIAGDDVRRL